MGIRRGGHTAQRSAQAQADAISSAKRDQTRARYEGLSKADLPRNGTNDELVDRLVDADTR